MRFLGGCIAILLLLCVHDSNAQFKVGVRGGAVLSTLVRDAQINANAGRVGYIFGANAKYKIGELGWFAGLGANYSLEGDSDQKLNFIKVPLVVGLDISDDLNIHVAYDFAWQVGNDQNAQDNYKSNANILGLGSEIYMGERFALGFRLNYGLSNLVNNPAGAKNFKIRPLSFDTYLKYFLF